MPIFIILTFESITIHKALNNIMICNLASSSNDPFKSTFFPHSNDYLFVSNPKKNKDEKKFKTILG